MAAVSQSFRTAQQKRLKKSLGDLGASYVRFSYAIPFAWAWLLFYSSWNNIPLPYLNLQFLLWVTVGGILQIAFTVLLIKLYSLRSFAAATAFSKTEVLQAVFFEAVILGVLASLQVSIAIALGVLAIILLSVAKGQVSLANLSTSLFTKQAGLGLAAGAFLACCSVCFRAATDSLVGDDLVVKAGLTSGIAVILQTIIMGIWMIKIARKELISSFREWRGSASVGFFGALTSFCWFYAFSANAVAPVRAVGQIELVLALLISIFFFKEKPSRNELLAICLLLTSIIMVLLD